MVLYNFKKIVAVPTADSLVDHVLSKTQRRTPTVVHKGYAIGRIRDFYMRKVKFTQQLIHDKLTQILEDFPRFDDLHPFYADLLNVLYDRAHYKVALGQLATARTLVDGIARDYVRLLKFGDSLYRCKCLKRAALGRMCTLLARQKKNLAYLEEVRQHLSRLPSIDPTTRTLLIAGFPNVGKSSFINTVTRADVAVEPYAFTTKSLFVGHLDYKYSRWQVIDTPGILDHELQQRNTIEMQSITALAHLRAAILFFVDPSEECGYTLTKQLSLFQSIMPLFANKPILVVANKTDLGWEKSLGEEGEKTLAEFTKDGVATFMKMSALDKVGVSDVKNKACELLLAARVESKMKGRKVQNALNRLHLATPKTVNADRKPNIPASVLAKRAKQVAATTAVETEMADDEDVQMETVEKRKTERDLQEENGGAGVYSMDWRKLYDLKKPEWAYDLIPEIVDGKNIADFVDPAIEERLAALEREEDAREAVRDVEDDLEVGGYRKLSADENKMVKEIKERKALLKMASTRESDVRGNRSVMGRTQRSLSRTRLEDDLKQFGVDHEDATEVVDRVVARAGRKRSRSENRSVSVARNELAKRPRASSRARSVSVVLGEGFKDVAQKKQAQEKARKKLRAGVGKMAKKGEADRSIPSLKPKHLFSGKRGIGKTDRR